MTLTTAPGDVDTIVDTLVDAVPAATGAPPAPRHRFARILLAVDGTSASATAGAWATAIARATGASVRVVTVVTPYHAFGRYSSAFGREPAPVAFEREATHGDRIIRAALRPLAEAGVPAEGNVLSGSPVHEIVTLARNWAADLVVVGSHGQGVMGRTIVGSVASGILNHAPATVLVARGAPPPRRVLAATDGSPASRAGVRAAVDLARAWQARADVLHVIEAPLVLPEGVTLDALRNRARSRETRVDADGVHVSAWLDVGHPGRRIVEAAAASGAGLVVVGARGHGVLSRVLSGTVSAHVAHNAGASVLVVKAPRS